MRPRCISLWLIAILCAACVNQHGEPASPPLVVEIIDGDTIVVDFPGHESEQVRLLGIDTPETVDPTRPVQCFGAEATAHLAALIPPGSAIYLERDLESRDRFGRVLAYVFREDGMFINAELLRNGFADLSIYEPNSAYAVDLRSALLTAQTQGHGLWSACGGPDVPLDPP